MHLTVLNHAAVQPPDPAQRRALAHDLARLCRGQVRFGDHDRLLYATDASIYQVEPLGVVIPADVDDAAAVVEFCGARSIAMLPRGGGTSLAGQCTSAAVVIDLTPACRGIGPVDLAGRTVTVEPGVSPEALNAELLRRGTGLFFAPDPATTAQAAIGGLIGNNAAGSRSVLYGRTSENLAAVEAVLADGRRVRFEAGAGARDAAAASLAGRVIQIVRAHEALIRARFPRTLRQNAGYGLDRLLRQLDAGADERSLDLAQLLAGSEGTLAVTLGATLKLHPIPRGKGLALLAFAGVDEAIAAVPAILTTRPSAVELVDDVVIEAARANLECARYVEAFPTIPGRPGDPAAVLYVEYHAPDGDAELAERFDALARVLGSGVPVRHVTDASGMNDAWKLRKAGEPLLHGLPGPRKPLTFVEDNAVPVERLGDFVREFRRLVERAGTRAAFWAHASVGVLHVRPMLDPHSPADLATLRQLAVDVADLAKRCGGVMSGEHGDGRVRGPLLERFFGPELMGAFGAVKAVFDPKGLLNPGNIVAPGPIDSITQRTRTEPATSAGPDAPAAAAHDHPRVPDVATFFDYRDQEGFDHAVNMCNGAGVCRKTSGGTMCPSFRGTLDERHSTRGRGNALRLAITGQFAPGAPARAPTARLRPGAADRARDDLRARFDDAETLQTLDLCLSCKACKSECPSNVDIARLKAEYTAQRYALTGRVPLAARLTGHVRTLNRLGSVAPRLANAFNALPPVRALIDRAMALHPRRSLPPFSPSLYRQWPGHVLARAAGPDALPDDAPRVALFADCFTTYNESHLGVAAGRLLLRLGYRPLLPAHGCCGRSMISVGMLPQAIATIDRTIRQLRPLIEDPGVRAIVFAEPSCLSAVKDDWLQLRCSTPLALRQKLAAKAMLVEEFVDRAWTAHPRPPLPAPAHSDPAAPPVLLHGHCHQKALWGVQTSAAALRRVFGPRLRVLDTGCCGLAGSFGYGRDRFELSMKIAELPGAGGGPMPPVREALASRADALVCAPGTSCRHQIKDAAGQDTSVPLRARHPVELLAEALDA